MLHAGGGSRSGSRLTSRTLRGKGPYPSPTRAVERIGNGARDPPPHCKSSPAGPRSITGGTGLQQLSCPRPNGTAKCPKSRHFRHLGLHPQHDCPRSWGPEAPEPGQDSCCPHAGCAELRVQPLPIPTRKPPCGEPLPRVSRSRETGRSSRLARRERAHENPPRGGTGNAIRPVRTQTGASRRPAAG